MADTIVYHAGCPDGYCAAFIAAKRWLFKPRLVPYAHGQAIDMSDFRDKDVLVVDFSWKRDVCEQLAKVAKAFWIIDHHVTAEEELKGLSFATFDMKESGASLTHKLLFPNMEEPWYASYVKDRDLWQWKLPHSESVNSFLMALPHDVERWKRLDEMDVLEAVQAGAYIRLHVSHYIERMAAERQLGLLHGYRAAIVNAGYPNSSDIGAKLFVDIPGLEVSVIWFQRGDGLVQFGLRGLSDGVDVSLIAIAHGGGGHKAAAGFQLKSAEARELLDYSLKETWTPDVL